MTTHLGPAATAFVDGQLDHRRRDEVITHLVHCERCRTDVQEVRRLKDAMREAGPPVPFDLSLRLLASTSAIPTAMIRTAPTAKRPAARRHPRLRRTALGGALVVLGVGGTLAVAGPPPGRPPAQVDPTSVRFVIDHASTSGEVPFTEPDLVPVSAQLGR